MEKPKKEVTELEPALEKNAVSKKKKAEEVMMGSDGSYYLAINDVTIYLAHYDVFNKKIVYRREKPNYFEYADTTTEWKKTREDYRAFNPRFVRSIKEAFILAIREMTDNLTDEEIDMEKILNEVKFDVESNCFNWDEYLTLGTNKPPKECQWKMFYEGKYEFRCYKYEIQIVKTEIPIITSGILKDISNEYRKFFKIPGKKTIATK